MVSTRRQGVFACTTAGGCGCSPLPGSRCSGSATPCNVKKLTVSGVSVRDDQAVAFWIKCPSLRATRQSVYDFGYWAEGALVLETDDSLNIYFGVDGDPATYYGFKFSEVKMTSAWTHVVLLRDFQGQKTGASLSPKKIGGGYVNDFGGSLYDFRVYNRVLFPWEIERLAYGGNPIVAVGDFGDVEADWSHLNDPGLFLRPGNTLRVVVNEDTGEHPATSSTTGAQTKKKSSRRFCDSDTPLSLGVWTKVRIVRTTNELSLMQDGIEVCRTKLSTAPSSSMSSYRRKKAGFFYVGGGSTGLRRWRYSCLKDIRPRFRLNQTHTTKLSLTYPYKGGVWGRRGLKDVFQ
eukprot:jgi/Bigna1/130825/aug1.12_g5533